MSGSTELSSLSTGSAMYSGTAASNRKELSIFSPANENVVISPTDTTTIKTTTSVANTFDSIPEQRRADFRQFVANLHPKHQVSEEYIKGSWNLMSPRSKNIFLTHEPNEIEVSNTPTKSDPPWSGGFAKNVQRGGPKSYEELYFAWADDSGY